VFESGFQPASFQVLGFFFWRHFLRWQKFRFIFIGFQNWLVFSSPVVFFKFGFDWSSWFLLAKSFFRLARFSKSACLFSAKVLVN